MWEEICNRQLTWEVILFLSCVPGNHKHFLALLAIQTSAFPTPQLFGVSQNIIVLHEIHVQVYLIQTMIR